MSAAPAIPDTVVMREQRRLGNLYLPGWSTNGSLILQDARQVGRMFDIQVDEVTVDGRRRPVAVIADASPATLRVDHIRRRLFVTRAAAGIHNIHVLSLADGKLRQVTANDTPGVYFSGITPLRADAILFARDERKRDIWLVQRKSH
jgi:hypothetical protein